MVHMLKDYKLKMTGVQSGKPRYSKEKHLTEDPAASNLIDSNYSSKLIKPTRMAKRTKPAIS
jgi:hypothetical protein